MAKLFPNEDAEATHDKTKTINKGFRPYVETESSPQDAPELVPLSSDQSHQNVIVLRQNLPNNSAPHTLEVQAAQNVIDNEEAEPVQQQARQLNQGRLTMFGFTTKGNQLPFHVICRECGWKLKNKKSKKNERGRRCHQKLLDRLSRQ